MILNPQYFDKHGDYLTNLYNTINESNAAELIIKARIIRDQVQKENDVIIDKQIAPFRNGLFISFFGLVIFGISNLIRFPSKIMNSGEIVGLGTILLGPIYMTMKMVFQ